MRELSLRPRTHAMQDALGKASITQGSPPMSCTEHKVAFSFDRFTALLLITKIKSFEGLVVLYSA